LAHGPEGKSSPSMTLIKNDQSTITVDGESMRHVKVSGSFSRTVRQRWVRSGSVGLVVLAAILFLGCGVHQAWLDSPTFDEPVYVSAGLTEILHHDVTLNDEHPVLPKVLAALPVLLAHPVIPKNGSWNTNDERSYSATFLNAQRRAGTLRAVTFSSRLVPLLEAVALAFVLFALGRDLFGRAAGALSGSLWLLSPFVVGLSHLDGLDLSFALAVGCWSWALLRWMRHSTTRRTVVLGIATAAAVLTDVTGLLLVLLGVVTILVTSRHRSLRRGLRDSGLLLLATWLLTWVAYGAINPSVLLNPTVVLPSPYFNGMSYLLQNDTVPGAGYLLGVAWTGGRWWYWPGVLVLKTVPTTLVLLIGGCIGWIWYDRPLRRQALLVLAVPALCLLAFTVLLPRDIGLRYLLPVLALWLVAASSVARVALQTVVGAVSVASIVVVAGMAMVLSSPFSLAWVNPPLGPAYRIVTNSDVDWGQGFYRLEAWSIGKHPWVAYFGPRGLETSSIPHARRLVGTKPDRIEGWVAVSATDLTSAESASLAWLRAYCPVGDLGGSILLYKFDHPPSVLPGPTEPTGYCAAGRESVRIRTATVPPQSHRRQPPTGA
jgi:Dolichyl-phosphate-mannose-protein mannosyltransferase